MSFLDYLFGSRAWYRRRRGGRWVFFAALEQEDWQGNFFTGALWVRFPKVPQRAAR